MTLKTPLLRERVLALIIQRTSFKAARHKEVCSGTFGATSVARGEGNGRRHQPPIRSAELQRVNPVLFVYHSSTLDVDSSSPEYGSSCPEALILASHDELSIVSLDWYNFGLPGHDCGRKS